MSKKIEKNQNETDVILSSRECIPRAVYMNKYGKEMNDAELGAFIRKSQEEYMKSVEENTPYWQEEGETFRKARQALNISQRELAAGIGVSAMTVGKYEKGKPVRSRKMLRQSGINVMELTQLKREKELNGIKEKIRNRRIRK